MQTNRIIFLATILAFTCAVGLFVHLGRSLIIGPWVLNGFLLYLAVEKMSGPLPQSEILWMQKRSNATRNVFLSSYIFLSLIGLILVKNYDILYGSSFAPYGDDSYYFNQILSLTNNTVLDKAPSFYEYFMSLWARLYKIFFQSNENLHLILLTINWAFGAASIYLIIKIVPIVVPDVEIKTIPLGVIALITNAIFSDSTVNLYRDGFMIMLFLLSVQHALLKSYKRAFLYVILTATVRMANGLLALFMLLFAYHARASITRQVKYLYYFSMSFLVIGIFIISGEYAGVRNIGYEGGSETESFSDLVQNRSKVFLEEKYHAGDESTIVQLSSNNFSKYLSLPIVTLFSPIRLNDLFQTIEVHNYGLSYFYTYGIYPRALWLNINVFMWVLLGPGIITGLINLYQGDRVQRAIFYLFVLSLFSVSYVSFQPRHRLSFIILFPILFAKNNKHHTLTLVLRTTFILLILAMNLKKYINL